MQNIVSAGDALKSKDDLLQRWPTCPKGYDWIAQPDHHPGGNTDWCEISQSQVACTAKMVSIYGYHSACEQYPCTSMERDCHVFPHGLWMGQVYYRNFMLPWTLPCFVCIILWISTRKSVAFACNSAFFSSFYRRLLPVSAHSPWLSTICEILNDLGCCLFTNQLTSLKVSQIMS